ncbi:hypothetical protein H1C71_037690, partial [Ictidomys tridecemlineatus]
RRGCRVGCSGTLRAGRQAQTSQAAVVLSAQRFGKSWPEDGRLEASLSSLARPCLEMKIEGAGVQPGVAPLGWAPAPCKRPDCLAPSALGSGVAPSPRSAGPPWALGSVGPRPMACPSYLRPGLVGFFFFFKYFTLFCEVRQRAVTKRGRFKKGH